MATIPIRPVSVVGTVDGGPEFRLNMKEAASQTFKIGAILGFADATGYVSECADSAAGTARIVGVALEPGHNSASAGDEEVLVAVADGRTIFDINMESGQVTAQSDIGRPWQICKDGTSGYWVIDKSAGIATTGRRVQVVDFNSEDQIGDTCGRVHVIFSGICRALTFTS